MEVLLKLCVDSVAFAEYPEREMTRILGTVARKVRRQLMRSSQCVCDHNEEDDLLRDINGNKVGTVEVLEDGQ